MCGVVWVADLDGQWFVAGSSFPRGRVRHENGCGVVGVGRKSAVCKSPRVADYRGQETGWLDNRVGDNTRVRHGPRAEGNRKNRTECPPRRRQHYREVLPREGWQSVGLSQVG